jgi:signal transduction histidine kinase
MLLLIAASAAVMVSIERGKADFWSRHAIEAQIQINQVETTATEAETGQRGYLITGRSIYLEPYNTALRDLGPLIDRLAAATADNPAQQNSVESLRGLVARKLDELRQTVDLRTAGRAEDAVAIVKTDSGREIMAAIRRVLGDMRDEEARLFEERSERAVWLEAIAEWVFVGCLGLVLALAGLSLTSARRRQLELQTANSKLLDEATERRAAEAQLRQLQKMEAIGQLAGGIAHDFNNMLAVIIGSLEMARRRLVGEQYSAVEKSIDNAMEGANRAAMLTKRILAFSRQQALAPTVLDANKLVSGMSELLRRSLGEPIDIETVLAGGIWKIYADASQLESALVNIAVNARDAMPNGGKLTIETANVDLDERYAAANKEVNPGQHVMISMTDTGVGMPPMVMERVFDPFYTTKESGKGTGLGLSQVFGFVKQSAGHIKIYSEVGRGTSLKIYLPRHFDEASAAQQDEYRQPPPVGSADKIILVVEDEPSVRAMTVSALRELGYTVIHADRPSEALQRFDSQPGIALLFTDIVMPEMSGRELAKLVTARRPELKVLYTTGYTRNAIVHHGVIDAGAAFIAKPFTLNELATKIEQTLLQR